MSQTIKLFSLSALVLIIVNLGSIPVVVNGRSIKVGETAILDGDENVTIIIEDEGVSVYGTK